MSFLRRSYIRQQSRPSLLTAQVQGWPPLHKIGVYTGVILASLDLQITSAEDLLRHPEEWETSFAEAARRYPEVAPAVAFFRDEYIPMREAERSRLTNPFFDKIFPFTLDPHLNAMFGSNTLGIDWHEVVQSRQTVLLDFRSELDPEMRRFKLLWVFAYLYEWIKTRGRSTQPFGLIIDEFAHMTQKVFQGENPLASELDEFINVFMRAHSIWFTAAHQELYQIDEQLRNTLLSLGTYVLGSTSSMESARVLADALFLRDPYWVKHYQKVWAKEGPAGFTSREQYFVLDVEPEYMALEEQTELFAQRIKKLGLFQFLLRPALAEGHIGSACCHSVSVTLIGTRKQGNISSLSRPFWNGYGPHWQRNQGYLLPGCLQRRKHTSTRILTLCQRMADFPTVLNLKHAV